MKSFLKLWGGVWLASLVWTGTAFGQFKPQSEIESAIKKLNEGSFRFHPNEGQYRFVWKDDDGATRYGTWFVKGSEVTEQLETDATVLALEIELDPNTDATQIQERIKNDFGVRPVKVADRDRVALVFPIVLDHIITADELEKMAKRVHEKVEKASVADAGGLHKETVLRRLRAEERKYLNSLDYSEQKRVFWQKKYDDSVSPDPNKMPNYQAYHYANHWEFQRQNAERRLEDIQDQIAEWESK